jgi:predicted glycosyltransferase|tara:strand:- start:4112 stop:5323 length:1212 start_codon:yes stop_codon:yes gene_type:complete
MSRQVDILFWVTHLFGIGHLRRAMTLTQAFQQAGLRVLLVSGGRPLRQQGPEPDLGGARFHQLPALHAADETFTQLLQADGAPLDDRLRAQRRETLLALFQESRPKVLLTEMFPLGRKQLRFELHPLLAAAWARPDRPLILGSVRDLLVQKPAEKTRWMAETVSQYYDKLLIHGDPDIIPLSASFPQHRQIAAQLLYSGYVLNQSPPAPSGAAAAVGQDEILVSAGGGAFGWHLLDCALKARDLSRFRQRRWRFLTGTNRPEAEFRALRQAAPAGVIVERSRADFPTLLANCRLSLSQGGYNTVVESLAARAPTLVVPFTAGGQSEQLQRARLLADRGALRILEDRDLSPENLAAALDALPRRRELTYPPLASDGARRSAELIKQLLTLDRSKWTNAVIPVKP